MKALYEGYDRGAENVVLVNELGEIAEGPGFNIFAVSDGAVVTPPSGVLMGITRQSVLDICAELESPHAPSGWLPSTLPRPTRFLSPRQQAVSCRLRASTVTPSGMGRSAR